jgi:hypothetical protein
MWQALSALFFGNASTSRRPEAARSRLEIEALGGPPLRAVNRPSALPAVEQLEERRVLSTSGVISAITDNTGQTAVFALGTDQRIYEMSATQTHGAWMAISDPNAGAFRQVSAGLDASGRAVCYGLHAADSAVWKLDVYGLTSSSPHYDELNLGLQANGISGTRNNEVFAIRANSASGVSIYNANSNSWFTWNGPWGGVMQISTGVDRYGHDEVYILNGNHEVYRLDNGVYWKLPMHATQISAGVGSNWTDVDLFYISSTDTDAYHYDGSNSQLVAYYCSQISAGLDRYGNEIVYTIDLYYHWMYRHDLSGNLNGEWESGNITQISAAGNDMVFAVTPGDNSVWVYDRDWMWNGYYSYQGTWSGNGWHPLYGNTSSPLYAPLEG